MSTTMMLEDLDAGRARIAVAVVAGEPSLRRVLARALHAPDIRCSKTASIVDELASVRRLDVAVLQATGEREELLGAVRTAKAILGDAHLIVVCPLTETRDGRSVLRAGADGLVTDAEAPGTLAPTVRAVHSGLICVPRLMRAPLESEALSMREKQVLGMLVMGFTNSEIAAKLFLAESTVKSHLSSAYTKLGVRTRQAATNLILDPAEGLGPGILAIAAA